MNTTFDPKVTTLSKPTHDWLRKINVSMIPGPMTPMVEDFFSNLLDKFRQLGHKVTDQPNDETDLILTSAPYGESVSWRQAVIFRTRRDYKLSHTPTVITILQLTRGVFDEVIHKIQDSLKTEEPDPGDYDYPGLAPNAYRVLHEQGLRGGPVLALERIIQAQAKSVRNILLIGDDKPYRAYHFDLVGAHPFSDASDLDAFYTDIVLRTVTTLSTREITDHMVVEPPITRHDWDHSKAPSYMLAAAKELGQRDFFTDMVRISDLVQVPAVEDVVSSQYSEGCFVTWDPQLNVLLATVTGSARPVDKGRLEEKDLAVIVGVREDGTGALVREVLEKQNDPPSSEAVEMMGMDLGLPKISLPEGWGVDHEVPVIRSKLHGHRGIASYDPERVEHVPLDPPYYTYPVSCATEAQANGIIDAFTRSEALQNPEDPRDIVFTVLPGHGIVIAEKWVEGKVPFQRMWEYMDSGILQVDNLVPQGKVEYQPGEDGSMHLESE